MLTLFVSRQGIPVTLISDSVIYFTSDEFKKFPVEWYFQDVVASPYFPRSNGKAESAVKRIDTFHQIFS